MNPVPVPPHVFALDAHRLRYGQFHRNGGGVELKTYRATDLEHDLFATGPLGGPMHDPEVLRALLAKLQTSLDDPLADASLVLPDSWLRLAFVDAENLERGAGERDEILRWKLQRIVPFRVEELRLTGVEAAEVSNNGAHRRVLVGFALDNLLRQLESTFADRDIHLGLITNESLSNLAAVRDALRDVELGAVAVVSEAGYSLVFVLRGQPILQRFKSLPQLTDAGPPEGLVQRDLKLTEIYLREQVTQASLARVLLVAPAEIEDRWLKWLEEAFEQPPHPLKAEHLALTTSTGVPSILELSTLFGAASMEVR